MTNYRLSSPLIRQLFSFVSVGAVCYVVGISLLMFFVEIVKLEVNFANLISSTITIFVCYLLNIKFVFKAGRHSKKKEILMFFTFSLMGLLLNLLLLFLMTKYLPIWYVISKTLVIMLIAIFNFVIRKKFIFLD